MMSKNMKKYFEDINNYVSRAYEYSNNARSKGFDPEKNTEIILTRNMAERVIGLVSIVAPEIKNTDMLPRLKELESKYGLQDWRVAFTIALETAQEKFCKFENKEKAMEVGLRLGLAYITNGVVASPLEGFIRLELKDRKDGKGKFFSLYFGGPIRSAGTTATCIFVALSDYVRKNMGYEIYDPTEEEVKRSVTEIHYFHERVTNLQYLPSEEEIEFIVKKVPIQIDGDPSEDLEVPNYKDLERVKANRLRNGYCLVIAEGLAQKFPKFWGKFSKWNKDFNMNEWKFLEDFISLQKKIKAKGNIQKEYGDEKITPNYTYIKDLVAGRPILSHPMEKGGFRLRFGRTRNSGFSSNAYHPATLHLLDNYISIGTQLRTERPNKSTVVSICDSIEPPIIKLKNGDVIFIENVEDVKKYKEDVEEILFLGDVLINYGDFSVFNHILVPPGYCEEWWTLELKSKLKKEEYIIFNDYLKNPFRRDVKIDETFEISKKYKIPIHPKFTYHWKDIDNQQLLSIIDWLSKSVIKEERIIMPLKYDIQKDLIDIDPKRVLELIGVPHKIVQGEYVTIEGDWAKALMISLGFYKSNFDVEEILRKIKDKEDILDNINKISLLKIRDKSGLYIGARMGRPEKSRMRKMTGNPHVLFPVGDEGGRLRCFQSSLEKNKVTAEFSIYSCKKCNKNTIYPICETCNNETEPLYVCSKCGETNKKCNHEYVNRFKKLDLDINHYYNSALKALGLDKYESLVKGIRGTSNKEHIPENLAKGILRSLYGLHVNKDGTVRYDMTETTITHFKPIEIGTSVKKLKELGYDKDIYGDELTQENQILELKCQDLILPSNKESFEEGADTILFRVSQFIDELLHKLYKTEKFYNLKSKEDLVGHLVIGLSPHTSAGIIGRIIGFSETQGYYAHPYFHSFMRRDCDGDEACIMLLMDGLLNFSKKLLGSHRGATQDEPLVLSPMIIPAEVDDMVFDMDVTFEYPLEFYNACNEYKHPSEVKINTIKERLNTEKQYEGFGFTHPVENINKGVKCSGYKTIPTMEEKVMGQMVLAEKIRAVNEIDVARLIIERHFMRDIKGNLRKFAQQEFRCVKCNEKFRRPPLKGSCTKCGGKLLFTVSEGFVNKYLEPSLSLAERYELPSYLVQDLELTKEAIVSVFGKEKDKQEGLGKWFG